MITACNSQLLFTVDHIGQIFTYRFQLPELVMECDIAWNVDVFVDSFMVGFKQQHLGREVKHIILCKKADIDWKYLHKKHFIACKYSQW